MNRTRATWLAAAVAAAAVVALVLHRWRGRTTRVPASTAAPLQAAVVTERVAPAAVAEGGPMTDVPVIEEDAPVQTEMPEIEQAEKPLATWLRVAIVVVALLAFFAVSLLATKQV